MKKIILGSIAAVLVIAVAVAAVLWLRRPQVIILKDGTKLTLVGVDYGKHHVFKGVKTTGAHLHGRTTLDTTNDTLMVWIESERPHGHSSNQFWPNYQVMAYDTADTACVASWQSSGQQIKSGVYVQGFTLNAFPRRDGKFILRISSWGNSGMHMAKGQFVISNPGSRSFPQWLPESLPDTQSDGDLDVTLTRCVAGVPCNMYGSQDLSSKDPMRKGVLVAFHTEQNGNTVTNWQPVAIETADATGNRVIMNGWSSQDDRNSDKTMTYQWGLWPDEAAWKLRVEMSRTSGFTNSEIWSVTNVPVGKGSWNDLWNFRTRQGYYNSKDDNSKPAFAETTINGVHLRLYPAIQVTDQNFGMGQKQGGFHVSVDPQIPDGYRLSLVEATDERGRKLQSWGPNGGQGMNVFQLPNIGNAKFLNFTIALHKSRFVEFKVKPTDK